MPADDQDTIADQAISKALGEELRRVRDTVGLTRAEVVERATADIHARTYATYEHGTRQCTVARLVDICAALGVGAPEVLELALQRARLHLQTIGLQVDLHAVLRDTSAELKGLRSWAHNRLAANLDSPGIARLTVPALQELAVCVGISRTELVRQLITFTPGAVRPR